MSITIAPVDNGIHYRSTTVKRDGHVALADYVGRFDGTVAAVTGSVGLLLPVSLIRLNARTICASYVHGLRVVATSRWVITARGDSMLITTHSLDSQGIAATSLLRFQRTVGPAAIAFSH